MQCNNMIALSLSLSLTCFSCWHSVTVVSQRVLRYEISARSFCICCLVCFNSKCQWNKISSSWWSNVWFKKHNHRTVAKFYLLSAWLMEQLCINFKFYFMCNTCIYYYKFMIQHICHNICIMYIIYVLQIVKVNFLCNLVKPYRIALTDV